MTPSFRLLIVKTVGNLVMFTRVVFVSPTTVLLLVADTHFAVPPQRVEG